MHLWNEMEIFSIKKIVICVFIAKKNRQISEIENLRNLVRTLIIHHRLRIQLRRISSVVSKNNYSFLELLITIAKIKALGGGKAIFLRSFQF